MIIILTIVTISLVAIGYIVYNLKKLHNIKYTYSLNSIIKHNSNFIEFSDSIEELGLPLIKIDIDNNPYYFMIDSGASMNFMTTSLYNTISHISHPTTKSSKISTGNGTIYTNNIIVPFSINDTSYNDIFGVNKDLEDHFYNTTKNSKYLISGIIGNSFLRKYNWVIDFNRRILYVNQNKD